jgi:hypothetical protein
VAWLGAERALALVGEAQGCNLAGYINAGASAAMNHTGVNIGPGNSARGLSINISSHF